MTNASNKRNLVFISHATPEDNCFTIWLSTRLKLMGYEVWSDATQLFGGEKWWEDIEEAIKKYSCKFILVITKTSLSKPGVKKEIELALKAETSHKLPNYIIPIIIDDSGFTGLPYGLSNRNIIPFSTGWAVALGKLTERLRRDGIPAHTVVGDLSISLQQQVNLDFQLETEDDSVLSNWLEVENIPESLSFYRLPIKSKEFRKYFNEFHYPWFEWGSLFVTFSDTKSINSKLPFSMLASAAPKLNLKAVLKNESRHHDSFLRGEVIKQMNYLISQAWNGYMSRYGLHSYEMSSGRLAWFFPDDEKFSGRLPYADIYGVYKKRNILGYSPKNKVFWHFAIEVKAQYGQYPKICLIPHVVFSEDGERPLVDKKKMHRLRRGFCKMWWNDRWRDMLLLYLTLLSNNKLTIELPVGEEKFISVNARPTIFISPVTLKNENGENGENDFIDVEVEIEEHIDE